VERSRATFFRTCPAEGLMKMLVEL